jgi:hypothetical protein
LYYPGSLNHYKTIQTNSKETIQNLEDLIYGYVFHTHEFHEYPSTPQHVELLLARPVIELIVDGTNMMDILINCDTKHFRLNKHNLEKIQQIQNIREYFESSSHMIDFKLTWHPNPRIEAYCLVWDSLDII